MNALILKRHTSELNGDTVVGCQAVFLELLLWQPAAGRCHPPEGTLLAAPESPPSPPRSFLRPHAGLSAGSPWRSEVLRSRQWEVLRGPSLPGTIAGRGRRATTMGQRCPLLPPGGGVWDTLESAPLGVCRGNGRCCPQPRPTVLSSHYPSALCPPPPVLGPLPREPLTSLFPGSALREVAGA